MPTAVDYDPFASKGTPVDYDPFATKRSAGEEAKYIGGRTARLGIEALASIPLTIADAANALVNLGATGIDKVAGTHLPRLAMPSQTVSNALDKVTPASTTPIERISDVGAAALGGAGWFKAGASILSELPRLAPMLRTLADSPALQATGAMAGAAATEGAREAGIKNPAALAGIGMVGSILPGTGLTATGRTLSGLRQAAAPFTPRGKEILVGEALNRVASNPSQAAETLAGAHEIVPGSRPTVGQAARDAGLIGADSAVRGLDERNLIGGRLSEQNTARMAELNRIAGDEGTLARAQAKRDRTFDEMAEPAFENSTPLVMGQRWIDNPVLRTIREIRDSPAGKRQTVQDAMDVAEAMVTQEGLTDARALYEVRKDLDLARQGKLKGAGKTGRELANMGAAKRELDRVIRTIDDTIETGAPGYRDYMQMFAKRSIPLEDIQALQSLRERAVLAAPDSVTQQDILSQAKFRNLLRNNIETNPRYSGRGPGAATMSATVHGSKKKVLASLSPNQLRTLDRIAQDLDRGAATSAATVKSPGSDTFKNMSVAAVIGRILGDQAGKIISESSAGKTLARPFNFLYRVPDQDVQRLMLEAWLDPQLASRLMRQATRAEIEGVATELKRRAGRQAAAAAIYGAAE